jgi:hypothetical protein
MEFSVSTKILKNETLSTSGNIYQDFKPLGSRGVKGQSGVEFLDKKTGVIFYTLPNLNAIACWRTTNSAYTIKSQGRVYMNAEEMVFPNDVKVDDQSRLWVLSDRLHKFMYDSLDQNDVNFRVLTATVAEAIDHTACDPKVKALPDLINKLGDILSSTTPKSKSNSIRIVANSFVVFLILFVKVIL